jgi:hypothetical protein
MSRARAREQVQKTPRTDKVNERYYELFNEPSFRQFGNDFHFYDKAGRLYRIASQNGDEFQNQLLRQAATQTAGDECVQDTFGHTMLYVKLRSRKTQWFDDDAVDRAMIVYARSTGKDRQPEAHLIRIREMIKPDYKRRTGTIMVSGLTRQQCREILRRGVD